MNLKITYLLSILSVILLSNSFLQTITLAQQGNDAIFIGKYRILNSKILNEDCTLLISLPSDYEGATISYSVLYLLYGDQVRGYFAETRRILESA